MICEAIETRSRKRSPIIRTATFRKYASCPSKNSTVINRAKSTIIPAENVGLKRTFKIPRCGLQVIGEQVSRSVESLRIGVAFGGWNQCHLPE
jgi:hypothetical protein